MKKHLIIYIIACIALPFKAMAQQENVRTATLAEFINEGLQNNYDLQIVRNDERNAEANATRANAGMLPTVNLSAGYGGSAYNRNTTTNGTVNRERGIVDHTLSAGINADWTIFDGFKIQTNYKRLQELRRQSATQTRIAIEDYVAEVTAEYYNFVQQRIRMRNLRHAVALSRERLRIVHERWAIGSASRLELQQAQVDFNADSAQSLKQRELLASSRIRLNHLMAAKDLDSRFRVRDTAIHVQDNLSKDSLWEATLRTNQPLLRAAQEKRLAELDVKSVQSRDFPYVRLNAGYDYAHNRYGSGTSSRRDNFGADFGVTVGYKIFDGNRKRERMVARINLDNAELARQQLELDLRADLSDLWQAYQNNLRLLSLERQNLITAQDNHFIAHERFLLGDLAGIEMREAQQSLLDAEERILVAEYNTKLCEISLRQLSGGILLYAEP